MKAAIAAFLILLAPPSLAHEAPAGWSYDSACCSNKDCAIEAEEVRGTAHGWLITRLGMTVAYGSSKIKQSKDQDFHTCFSRDERDDPGKLLCLYVPPFGF